MGNSWESKRLVARGRGQVMANPGKHIDGWAQANNYFTIKR